MVASRWSAALIIAVSLAACSSASTPPVSGSDQPPGNTNPTDPGTGTTPNDPGGGTNPTPTPTPTPAPQPGGLAGSLDSSFHTNGTLSQDFGAPYENVDDLAVTPQGSVVAVVTRRTSDSYPYLPSAVVRFTASGTLDSSFDGDGRVDVAPGASRLALQGDGKVIVGGGEPTLTRLNADGSLDPSYGGTGKVNLGFTANDLALQPDGKLVVIGNQYERSEGPVANWKRLDLLDLARLNPDGSLDASFGSAGKVQFTEAGMTRDDASGTSSFGQMPSDHLALTPDGEIATGGWFTMSFHLKSGGSGTSFGPANMRFSADGSRDATFGNPYGSDDRYTGLYTISYHGYARECDLAVASDGALLVAFTDTVRRIAPDGKSYKDWATGLHSGEPITPNVVSVRVQPDGKVLAAGVQWEPPITVFGYRFVVTRFNPDGSLDSSFGSGGHTFASFGNEGGYGDALALGPNSTFVVGGTAMPPGGTPGYQDEMHPSDAAIARWWR